MKKKIRNNKSGLHLFMTMVLILFLQVAPAFAVSASSKVIASPLDKQFLNAVLKNDTALATQLLSQGADINITKNGRSVLELTVRKGNTDLAKLFLEEINNLIWINTALNAAVISANIELVPMFIAKGGDINNKQAAGMPPVFWASNISDAEFLIEHGADIHSTGQSNESILSYHARSGCRNNRAKLINQFMALGVRPDVAAFSSCAYQGNTQILKRILKSGFDINSKGFHGQTALKFVTSFTNKPNREIVKFLLKEGADPNIQDDSGSTALMSLAFNGQTELIEVLLAHGANEELRDKYGETALDKCNDSIRQYGASKVPESLLESKRILGGMRVSIYNAIEEGMDALVAFMQDFKKE